jgi:sodium-dependent dicarboxylate transporter 2/3/5
LLFFVRVGPAGTPVLERRDFQAVDWDTLFLIAGGLCLGKVLQASGAAAELAAAIGRLELPPLAMMFGLGLVTLALSELTSNTATASLMVPIAASLAPAMHLSPVQTIWLVALCASLGFALPVSTPPNAIIYGTGLVPLRGMIRYGVAMDLVALGWVVGCLRWLG